MDWIAAFFTGGGSLLGGGLIGLGKVWIETKTIEKKNKHELEMRNMDSIEMQVEAKLGMETIAVESQAQQAIAESQRALIADKSAGTAQLASISHEQGLNSDALPVWVQVCRAMTRVALTWLVVVAALCISIWMIYLTPNNAVGVFQTVFALAATAFGWWFGERGSQIGKNIRAMQ